MDAFRYVHPRILGTFVSVTMFAPPGTVSSHQADALDTEIADEFERLEQIFSVYRADSELERWKRGELDPAEPSSEFCTAMREALVWQHRSDGAFHTASGAITDLWRGAAERGTPPTDDDRADARRAIEHDAYFINADGVPIPGDGAQWVNLNAFAKGWIVDRVVDRAMTNRLLAGLIISAGGDLRHRGSPPTVIGVDNPLRPYDNEPPLAQITITDQAVATSGGSRRGFRIGNQSFSHVIDPRTGDTVEQFASVTIVAETAATADVLATIIGLAKHDAVLALADDYGVAVMVVLGDGTQLRNARFDDLVVR